MGEDSYQQTRSFFYVIRDKLEVVRINEQYTGEYGCVIWPSADALARIIANNESFFAASRVLELGCGPGLPGIVAAKCGSRVFLSDLKDPECILENCRVNCKQNHVESTSCVVGLFIHPYS